MGRSWLYSDRIRDPYRSACAGDMAKIMIVNAFREAYYNCMKGPPASDPDCGKIGADLEKIVAWANGQSLCPPKQPPPLHVPNVL